MRNISYALAFFWAFFLAVVGCNSQQSPAPFIIGSGSGSGLGATPIVTSISPSQYGVNGGATVTINGENFTEGSTVALGGSTCDNLTITGTSQITCTISYHRAAVVDVVVANAEGHTGTLVSGFSYDAFLYASNQSGSPALRKMRIASATGSITDLGTTSAPNGAYGVEMHPTNKWVYAAGVSANSIAAFSIDHSTGDLTAVSGSPFAAGSGVNGLATSSDGKCLVASNFYASNVSSYLIDQNTGALSPVANYGAGSYPGGIAIDHQNRFAYVANYSSNNVSAYAIDTTTCTLTTVGTYATGNSPDGVVIHPSGNFLYTGNANATGGITGFTINSTTGALTLIATYTTSNATNGSGVEIDSTGFQLYATARGGGSAGQGKVWGYNINQSTGALTVINSWSTENGPNDVRIQATGGFVFTANTESNTINVFIRDQSNGNLSAGTPASFSIGNGPGIIAITK